MIKPLTLSLFRENQHAIARENRADPPILVKIILIGSVKGDPSKRLMTNDGVAIKAKPVAPSKNEVVINNPLTDPTLFAIYRAEF